MGSRADKAWRAATECARHAQQPDRDQDYFLKTRDAWIADRALDVG